MHIGSNDVSNCNVTLLWLIVAWSIDGLLIHNVDNENVNNKNC